MAVMMFVGQLLFVQKHCRAHIYFFFKLLPALIPNFIIVCTCMFMRNYCDSLLPSTVCSVLSYVRTSWCRREFHSHFVCSIPTPSAEVPLHLDLPFTSAKKRSSLYA